MKTPKKQWVALLLILLLLIPCITVMAGICRYQDDSGGGFRSLYSEKADIDVMIFGSSHAACTVNNALLWNDAGIASYTLSAGGQDLPVTYHYLKEAISVKHPSVVLVETLSCSDYLDPDPDTGRYDVDIGMLYRSDLSMRFSQNYIDMILDESEHYNITDSQRNDLLFKWPVIHTRYRELPEDDIVNFAEYVRGYKGDDSVGSGDPVQATSDSLPISAINEEYLNRIMDLCESTGTGLIFFCAPYPCASENVARQNTAAQIAAARGVPYCNMDQIYEEAGLDFSCDLRDDDNHLNNSGADKVTSFLEKLLAAYDLPDRRGQKGYENWDKNSTWLRNKEDISDLAGISDITEYASRLASMRDKYTIIISMTGSYDAQGAPKYSEALEILGISSDAYTAGGTAVFEKGTTAWYSTEKLSSWYTNTASKRLCVYNGDPDGSTDISSCTIYVGDEVYTSPENGFMIFVYDEDLDQFIDCASIDVFVTDTLTRSSSAN